MKAILLSVQPKWLEKILNGEKTIEIRKSMPKCDLPIEVYLYCTKKKSLYISPDGAFTKESITYQNPYNHADFGFSMQLSGKVVAKFTLSEIAKINIATTTYEEYDSNYKLTRQKTERKIYGFYPLSILEKSCLTKEELGKYAGDKATIHAWHIDDLVVLDEPMELGDFKVACKYKTSSVESCIKKGRGQSNSYDEFNNRQCISKLIRPPQSWQYVEVDNG